MNRIFKEPDHRDSFGRYLFDGAHRDFWATKNIKGKIICVPMFVLCLALAIPLMLLGDLDKKP